MTRSIFPLTEKCKFYKCTSKRIAGREWCEQHDNPGSQADMKVFYDLKAEGYSTYEAAVKAGIDDPHY